MSQFRIEKDSMGEMQVPKEALYGAQTARAIENFPISGQPLPRPLVRSLALIKQEAAKANHDLGLLPKSVVIAIIDAAEEVILGTLDDQFPVDIYQTGSGTSSNMNMNEVIAHRATTLLKAGEDSIHPNDQVNLGQSSNDTFPTALHLATATETVQSLLPELQALQTCLQAKADAFDSILTIGRTHLQDAVPIRLGQPFGGYAQQVKLAQKRIQQAVDGLMELPLGGTAVGTGLNTHPEFAARVIEGLANVTELPFVEAENHFEAQGARDALVQLSGSLKTTAAALFKIANDIRFLGSGPRCGLGQIKLPPVQPGSSIMPGKVNPVMAESLIQVCARVIGNDSAVTLGGLAGNFELNVMMPLIGCSLLESIQLMTNSVRQFRTRCVEGLEADRDACEALIEQSLAMCTALAPALGYDRAAALAKEAWKTGRTVREVALEQQLLPEDELNRLLDPAPMTRPGIPGKTG